ncbi:MAG: 2-oxoglutarate dehydrogenase [Clostridia bacterium]|nr:2-oxoglutarate dehydrogenase [Clostridia bacterium]
MFGFRSDGKKVKNESIMFRIIPHIMRTREDSQVYFSQDVPIKFMEAYINKKAEEGIKISYMHIIYAAIIRTIKERPSLNRFVVDGRTYNRNDIFMSLTIKKSLEDNAPETVIKLKFTGKETILDIKEKLEEAIQKNKDIKMSNSMDKLVAALEKTPNIVLKGVVGLFKILDKYGILPKKIIELSPFHTSAFLTNVGSLGIDAIYHHLYNFGTTSLFFAMGKKKKDFIHEDEEIIEEKCISIAFVGDERICDGYYYANSFKLFNKYIKKPELLENNVEEEKKEEKVTI